MARPPLILETWGKIRRRTLDNGQSIAYTYYRDYSGRVRQVQRNGRTEPEAERNLIKALKERQGEGEQAGSLLSPDSTVSDLADKWLEELKLQDAVSGTYNTYRSAIRANIKPGIGSLRLREATVPRIDKFVKSLLVTPSAARTARIVLKHMFGLAVRHGAMTKNPAQDAMTVKVSKKPVKVILLSDVHAMRNLFQEYDADHTSELYEISTLIMSTGSRTAESLACRWEEDLDLAAGVLRISGTLSTDKETGKLFRQEHPKSEAGARGLTLPPTALTMLTQRRISSHYEMIFPSSTGTYRWPANTRRQWRQALEGSIYVGKTPRDFRKAVATHIDAELGIKAAQLQLGHGSEDITASYYLERQEAVADFAEVIEGMFESTG